MEAWKTYLPAILSSLIGPREIALVNEYLGGVEGAAIADILSGAVSSVRSACGRQGLGAPGSIPPECDWCLKAIFRYRVLSTIPIDGLVTETREKDYLEQLKVLRDIAAGKAVITPPNPAETASEDLSGGIVPPVVFARDRSQDWAGLQGT